MDIDGKSQMKCLGGETYVRAASAFIHLHLDGEVLDLLLGELGDLGAVDQLAQPLVHHLGHQLARRDAHRVRASGIEMHQPVAVLERLDAAHEPVEDGVDAG